MDDIVIVRSDNTIDFYLGNTRGLHLAMYIIEIHRLNVFHTLFAINNRDFYLTVTLNELDEWKYVLDIAGFTI